VDAASAQRAVHLQAQEGNNETVQAVLDGEKEPKQHLQRKRNQATPANGSRVLESYVASNSFAPPFAGLNFAIATPASEHVELIFAGQTGIGPNAPERFEATDVSDQMAVTALALPLPLLVTVSRYDHRSRY